MSRRLRSLRSLLSHGNAMTWGLLLTVIALFLALATVFRAYQSATWTLIHERDQRLAFLSAARIAQELTEQAAVLEELARQPEVHSGTASRRRAALREAALQLGVFDGGIVLLDSFGRVVETLPSRPGILDADWSGRDYFRAQLTAPGITLSDIYDDGPSRSPVVALGVPVLDAGGGFVGVLVGLFRLDSSVVSSLYASIVRLRLGQSGDTYVVDSQGRLIYGSADDPAGTPLVASGAYAHLDLSRPGTLRTADRQGHDVLMAHVPIPGTHWTLIVEDDWEALVAPIEPYRRLLLGLVMLAAALPVIGLAWTTWQSRQPGTQRWVPGQQNVAAAVHQLLAPRFLPMLPGWSLALHQRSGEQGPRDFHDFQLLPDGQLRWLICRLPADADGAAHIMSTLRAVSRSAALRGLTLEATAREASAALRPHLDPAAPLAVMWASLDPLTAVLSLLNAGCPAPRYVRAAGVERLAGEVPGLAEADWSPGTAVQLPLAPGDCLVCYSLPPTDPTAEAESDAELDAVLAGLGATVESAQCRLDDLVVALRAQTLPWLSGEDGYLFLVLAREVPASPEAEPETGDRT